MSPLVHTINTRDAERIAATEAADNGLQGTTGADLSFGPGDTGKRIISWEKNDKENPHNWSTVRQSRTHIAETYSQMADAVVVEENSNSPDHGSHHHQQHSG